MSSRKSTPGHGRPAARAELIRRRKRDQQPADAVFRLLIHHLNLARWGKAHSADKQGAADYERMVFAYLMSYAATFERPADEPDFDLLD
jgi:hypothetical protein